MFSPNVESNFRILGEFIHTLRHKFRSEYLEKIETIVTKSTYNLMHLDLTFLILFVLRIWFQVSGKAGAVVYPEH